MQIATKDVKIPAMVAAELLYGAEKSMRREQNISMVTSLLSVYETVPFDAKAIEYYATIRTELERKGQIIGGNDIIIAATVLAHQGILVSHNIREYSRIEELKLEDWTQS